MKQLIKNTKEQKQFSFQNEWYKFFSTIKLKNITLLSYQMFFYCIKCLDKIKHER